MPEPTPTTEPGFSPEKKQLPKWGIFAIIGIGVVGLLWYKHKRSQEEQVEFQPAETGGQTAEGTIYPDSTTGGAAAQLQRENNEFLQKIINEETGKKGAEVRKGRRVPVQKKEPTKTGGRGGKTIEVKPIVNPNPPTSRLNG